MKRFLTVILVLLTVLSAASCSRRSVINEHAAKDTTAANARAGFEDVTAPPKGTADSEPEETDAAEEKREAAMKAAKEYLGETDPQSGLKYSFSYDGEESADGKDYTKIRVSVHADDGTYTLCGYLLVDENGNITKSQW